MVRVDYRTPKQARRGYPEGSQKYLAKLIKAKAQPEKHSMPICYRHIEDLAHSISRRGLTDSVLVLVEPGVADPDRVLPNIFCCFLCQREGA